MTPQELAECTGARIDRATTFLPYIESAMDEFDISTPERKAAFLANVGHESGGLHWLVELWGPTPQQARYEGRADLGNTEPGDGYRYRGRGLVQLTGRANYAKAGEALGVDLVSKPEQLGLPELAARSAAWFWDSNGINEIADTGDFVKCCKRVNGGTNGLAERLALFEAAQGVFA